MTTFNRFYVSFLFTTLYIAYTPIVLADMQQSGYSNQVGVNRSFPPVNNTYDPQQQTFGQKGDNKALNAFANLTTSTLEIPKNIINTMNQSNFFYGVFGGFLKGLVNTLGRTGCGIVDFITLPFPTQPIVYPAYIWDDFDVDTTYGPVFRMDKTYKTYQPVTQTPVTQPVPPAVATPPNVAPVYRSNQYDQNTNRKLDAL
jgi:putative exosortase-associated protein (TIGR04073 family)